MRPKVRDLVKLIRHSNVPDDWFDQRQLAAGIRIEMEHTSSKTLAKAISKAHLVENPLYYRYLIPMERRMNGDRKKGGK